MSSDRLPRFGRRAALGVFAAFLLLGTAYTAPLVAHLPDALPYAQVPPEGRETAWRVQGDSLQFYYYLWLVRDRLLSGASVLRDPYQFAVDGPRLNLPNTFLPVALLYVPLAAAGPRLAYNILVLLSFPLAGLTAALLVHRYGVGRWAALVAGAIFACAPYRVGALLGGHPAGLAYVLAPLALWGLEGALAGSVAGGAWCGVALVSAAIVEPHFFYFAALGLPLYLLCRVALPGWARTREPERLGGAWWLLAGVVMLAPAWGVLAALRRHGWEPSPGAQVAIAGLVALGVLFLWQCGAGWLRAGGAAPDGRTGARRSLLACLPWLLTAAAGPRLGGKLVPVLLVLPALIHAAWLLGARPWRRLPLVPVGLASIGAVAGSAFLLLLRRALLMPSVAGSGRTLHEVLLFSPSPGDLLTRVNPAAGRTIYPGVVALGLTLLGAIALWRRAPEGRRGIPGFFGPLLLLGAALSLGPNLPGLPLFEAAYRLVPFWTFVRQPAKFQIAVSLALAVLAAAGTDALGARLKAGWRHVALGGLLAALIAAEYHPWRPIGLSLVPTGDEAYVAIRGAGSRALYIPLWPGDSSYSALYLYTTTLTRVPMLNGYSAWIDRAYVTDVYRALETVNLGVVGDAEYATLRRYGVRQVILDRDAFPMKVSPFGPAFSLAGLRSSPFLELVRAPTEGGPLWVFRVRDRPGSAGSLAPRSPLGIYWEAESLQRETGQITADAEASNGRVVMARVGRDRAGFLTYGPYRLLPPGPFHAAFRLRGDASTVELEVTAAGGRRVLAARAVRLSGGAWFQEVAVPFALEAPAAVEYRVRWDGAGWAAVDAVAVRFADVPDPAPAFEVEELGHDLFERPDPAASGGLAGYADPARTPRGEIWSGPLRGYPAGRYRLLIRLKLDRPTAGPIAGCGVQAASRGPTFGERELFGRDVPASGRYVELAVPFALPRFTVVEFPCLYRGTVGVWFDRLRVERLPA